MTEMNTAGASVLAPRRVWNTGERATRTSSPPPAGGEGLDRQLRALDLAIVAVSAPIVAPVLALAAMAIAIEDRGPILFRQTRIGRHGEPFTILKLRTMRQAPGGSAFTRANDDRITRVGKFLRRTRIDELPQVVNVLRGDMAICGPRPEAAALAADYARHIPRYNDRHAVRPGITGLAQVTQGYAAGVAAVRHKQRLDMLYIRRRSLGLTAHILYRTVGTLISGGGAR